MRFLLSVFLLALFPGLAACASVQSAAEVASCGTAGVPLRKTPAALTDVVASLQAAYFRGDWSEIRHVVGNPTLASQLATQMRTWKRHHVDHLTVSVLFAERLRDGRYIGTVRFQADQRAPPAISLLLFARRGGSLRVTGRVPGVCGSSYTQVDWAVTRTRHFIVYHSPFQLSGSDRVYLRYLEHQRALFAARFRVKLPALAVFYLYPNQALMRELTHGGCGESAGEIGCTDPFSNPPTIQAVIQAAYHEPIHVYERSLEPPPTRTLVYLAPLFIAEGTAVALEDRQLDPRLSDYCSDLAYAPLDGCARPAIVDTDPLSLLADSGFNRADPGDAYSLGGSFVKYLILRHGYYRFGRFYYVLASQPKDRISDYDVAARRVYGQSIRSLIGSWRVSLCLHGC